MGNKRGGLGERERKHTDKKDMITKFVRSNLLKLTSHSATKGLEKSMRMKFFEENSLPANSRFNAREVGEEVIKYILKSRSFGWEEFNEKIEEIPFMIDALNSDRLRILYQENTTDSSLFFEPSDLSKLGQEEYLERIEEEFKAKARERAEEEIDREKKEVRKLKEELEKKEENLKRFETELNTLPKDLSIDEIAQRVEKEDLDLSPEIGSNWWKRLGMPSNPLDTYDGLYGINENKYEQVVVKTSLINQYLGEIRDDPESFSGKTMIITGDYGSGKTTLFEYVKAQALSLGVVPLMVVLNPGPSVASLTNLFLQELRSALTDTDISINQTKFNSDAFSNNLYRDCLEVFKRLSIETPHGFLIFIDGLHKTKTYLEQVFEFLQQIQNTLTYFTRNQIKLGFVIAGSPYWRFELENNPSMSGSYYQIDEISILTEEEATEAIKKRMNMYQTESPHAITIDEGSLRKSFQVLSGRLPNPVTFRDFISHVRRRLGRNKFDEVGLSVKVHIETVDAVNASIRRSHLYNKYKSLLIDVSESKLVRKAMRRVLLYFVRYRGISESSPIFEKNKGAFYLLKRHDFIVQHRTSDLDSFKWHLSDDLITTILDISQRLNLEPSKIVQAMFEEETVIKEEEANSIYSASTNTIRGLISSWRESIPEVATLLENCKTGLGEIGARVAENKYVRATNLSFTLMQIIKAINVIMRPESSMESDSLSDFLESWAAPDNIDEIRDFCREKVVIRNETAKVYGLLHNHNKLISQLLDILSEQVKGESLARLNGRKLNQTQLSAIHQLRSRFQMQGYEEVIEGACNLLEKSIRGNVYPSMRCIWGKEAINKVPPDVLNNIKKVPKRGHPRTRRVSDPNFLYDVSRSEYTKILFKKDIYYALFSHTFNDSEKDKFKDAIELSFSLSDRTSHNDRKSYFRTHATEVADVLRNLPWVLEKLGDIGIFFLLTCKVEFKMLSSSELKSRLSLDSINTKEFVIEKRIIDSFSKTLLEILSFKEIVIDNLETMFLTTELEPETYLLAFRALLSENFISYQDNITYPGFIYITQKGRALLDSYRSNKVGINQL